jgi:hypothetical protein
MANLDGDLGFFARLTEGKACVRRTQGYRLPSRYVQQNPRFVNTALKLLPVARCTGRDFQDRGRKLCDLECKEGRLLLAMEEFDSLDNDRPLQRTLTAKKQCCTAGEDSRPFFGFNRASDTEESDSDGREEDIEHGGWNSNIESDREEFDPCARRRPDYFYQ